MDKELLELENELRALRPRALSQGLLGRVERGLQRSPRKRWTRALWFALPLATAAALVFALWPTSAVAPARLVVTPSAAPVATTAEFQPVSAENLLVGARDDGVVQLADGTRARRFRQVYVDRITWKNPATRASMTWTVPREELRVVPVSYQ